MRIKDLQSVSGRNDAQMNLDAGNIEDDNCKSPFLHDSISIWYHYMDKTYKHSCVDDQCSELHIH